MEILQILFFAGLAVFLGVRLYMALGRPTGRTHEEHVREEHEKARAKAAETGRPQPVESPNTAATFSEAYSGPAGEGLSRIADADPGFDPESFLAGARQAYEMIVLAYAEGDAKKLEPLLSERVYKAYLASIDARADAGQTMITEIERVKSVKIVEASLNDNRARVRVAIDAEIASEVRDGDDNRIEGDLSRLKPVNEIWSFERDISSDNPNWRLAGVKAS